ncbi:MAG: DUF4153 domain-containing protein [Oscillospiraceae bacterium]|jgi:hypothetical protein|nr:DUF4153 domain-containing protein [Oscillospiraceae bacterium]
MNFSGNVGFKFNQILKSVKRFIFSSVLIFVLFCLSVSFTLGNYNSNNLEYLNKIILTIGFGIICCIFFELIYEKYFDKNKQIRVLIQIFALFLSAIPYILFRIYNFNEYLLLGFGGILVSLILMIFYFSDKGNISATFSYIMKNILFNFFILGTVFIGGSLCISAFINLVHNFQNNRAYILLGEFSVILLFLHLCLLALPSKHRELTIPKVFKILVFKAMFPVYILLLLILYIYLFKILITWTFPSGRINSFVLISSFLYMFFVFALNQYKNENKLIKLFLDYSGYAVIPTVLMQFMAIYIRVSNYGLTSFRYISIIFGVFTLVFAIITLFRKEKILKNSLIVLLSFVLFLTVTPFNTFDIPILEQTYRLKKLLLKNQMLDDDKIIKNENIDADEKLKIMSAYNFIRKNKTENSHIKAKFLLNIPYLNENVFEFKD